MVRRHPPIALAHWEHVVYAVVLTAATALLAGSTLVVTDITPYVPEPLAALVLFVATLPAVGVLAAYADLPPDALALTAGTRPADEAIERLCRAGGVEAAVEVFDGHYHDAWVVGRRKRPGAGRLLVSDRLLEAFDRPAATALVLAAAHRLEHRHRLAAILPYYVAPVEVLLIVSLVPHLHGAGVVTARQATLAVAGGLLAGAVVFLGLRAFARRQVFAADDHAAARTDPATTARAIERADDGSGRLRRILSGYPTVGQRVARLRARVDEEEGGEDTAGAPLSG